MSIISSICFLGCVLTVASMMGKGKDPFSPGRIFLLIWLGAVGLADLKFSGYQSEWSTYAWVIMAVGIASFMLGLYICYVVFIPSQGYSIDAMRTEVHRAPFNRDRAFTATVGLFMLYIVCYVIEVAVVGQLPIFALKADRARIEFGVFGIHLIVTTMPTILFLVTQFWLLVDRERPKKIMLAAVFAVTLVTFFMLLQRFLFVTWALMALAFFYYTSKKFKFRWIVLAVLIFYALLQYLLSFRIAIYVKNFVYVISRMKYSEQYAVFTEPYMYIVMNIENYARAVDKLENFTFGYFTSDPVLALTGLKHWLAADFSLVERPFLVSVYNTFPYIWPYYHDFGILGVSLIPLAFGITIGIAYYRMRLSPTPFTVSIYSICFYFLVISFFMNPLTILTTFFNIVVVVVLQRWIAKADQPRALTIADA